MNKFKYYHNTVALDNRLKTVIMELKTNYSKGRIPTITEYSIKVHEAVNDFYKNLGKPSFTFREQTYSPNYNHYKNMIKEFKDDCSCILDVSSDLLDSNKVNNIETDEAVEILNNRLDNIDKNVNDIKGYITNLTVDKNIIFFDDFSDDKDSNFSSVNDKAYIDKANKLLSIVDINNTNLTPNLKVRISNDSNGFPGNTHECFMGVNEIKYVGESNPALFVEDIIDDNGFEWFEFESYSIDDDVYDETNGVGFRYKEDIKWIKDENEPLRLRMVFEFKIPTRANWIKIDGVHTSKEKYSVIKKVTIYGENTDIQEITLNKELRADNVINFNSQMVKYIIVDIEQQNSYKTDVCREYDINLDSTAMPFHMSNGYKDYIELDNPKHSIKELRLTYDTSDKKITYNNSESYSMSERERLKEKIFHSYDDGKDTKLMKDIVKANRKVIKVKKVYVKYAEYKNKGIYISKEFKADKDIKMISLTASDYIPEKFYKDVKKEDMKDWIEYYISIDKGSTWHKVEPRHRINKGHCTVMINSQTAPELRNKNILYIDTLLEHDTVKLKIVLNRPDGVKDMSPLVFDYKLDVSTDEREF